MVHFGPPQMTSRVHGSDELRDMLSSPDCHGYGPLTRIRSYRDAIKRDKVLLTHK
jgi:hypothetical protein